MNIIYKQSSNYIKQITVKEYIMLHWMAGTLKGTEATLQFPKQRTNVNVPYNIDREGIIYQYFDINYWAYHTGMNSKGKWCEKSVGIEMETWGHLTKKGNKFYNWVGGEVPANEVIELQTFRGAKYFHTLTKKQEDSLVWLCKEINMELPTIRDFITHAVVNPRKLDYPPDFPLPEIILCTNPHGVSYSDKDVILKGEEGNYTKKEIQQRINYLIKYESWTSKELNRLIRYRDKGEI